METDPEVTRSRRKTFTVQPPPLSSTLLNSNSNTVNDCNRTFVCATDASNDMARMGPWAPENIIEFNTSETLQFQAQSQRGHLTQIQSLPPPPTDTILPLAHIDAYRSSLDSSSANQALGNGGNCLFDIVSLKADLDEESSNYFANLHKLAKYRNDEVNTTFELSPKRSDSDCNRSVELFEVTNIQPEVCPTPIKSPSEMLRLEQRTLLEALEHARSQIAYLETSRKEEVKRMEQQTIEKKSKCEVIKKRRKQLKQDIKKLEAETKKVTQRRKELIDKVDVNTEMLKLLFKVNENFETEG